MQDENFEFVSVPQGYRLYGSPFTTKGNKGKQPLSSLLSLSTYPHLSRYKNEKISEWQSKIIQQIEDHKKVIPISGTCNIDITFYLHPDQYTSNPYGPDVDNLQKEFLDGLKLTQLIQDDCRITGIRAIKYPSPPSHKKDGKVGGVVFKIIPTYTLKILKVTQVTEEKDLQDLNPSWKYPMQKIEARILDDKNKFSAVCEKQPPRGFYIDNAKDHLFIFPKDMDSFDMDSFDKNYSQINPGFLWKENEVVRGVMILKRRGHYWLNTWNCEHAPHHKEFKQ